MVKSVVREHHWAPSQVGALYFDAIDYEGLVYWYEDVKEVDESLKEKTKTPKTKGGKGP
jgi:hypothetical protein